MRLLALDQAHATGWAVLSDHAPPTCGVRNFTPGAANGPLLHALDEWLNTTIDGQGITHLARERHFIGPNASTSEQLLIMGGHIDWIAWRRELPLITAHIGTWRAFFYARKFKKLPVKARALARCNELGVDVRSQHDAAEAVGIGAYAAHEWGLDVQW